MSHRAMLRLQEYSWPDNVRELENCIDSATSKVLDREILFSWDFPETISQGQIMHADELGEEGDTSARVESQSYPRTALWEAKVDG